MREYFYLIQPKAKDVATQEAAEEALLDITGETQQVKKTRIREKLGYVRATALDAIMAWDKIAQYVEPKLKQIGKFLITEITTGIYMYIFWKGGTS